MRSRSLSAARQVIRSRAAPSPNAGALGALEVIGRRLRAADERGLGLSPAAVAEALTAVRAAYRAVRALRPVA